MLPLEPQIHYGCQRCDGLFSTQELHFQHVVLCSGDRQKSDCPLFACPRDIFLLLNTQPNTSATPHSGDTNQTNRQTENSWNDHCNPSTKLQIPIALQKCLSGPLKKVRVIGILKKPPTRPYSASNHELLRNNADINLDKNRTAGNTENRDHLVQPHLCSEDLMEPEEATGEQDDYQKSEISPAIKENSEPENITQDQPSDDIHETALEDPNWEECKKDDHKVFRCKLCNHESYSVGYMQRHVQVHNNGETMHCDHCDFTTIWRHHLRVHLSKHEQPKFLCEQCPQQFKNRSSLTRHCAKKHKGKTNFSCTYSRDCDFVAVNSASLRDHIRKHTGEMLFCDYDQCKFMTKFEKALALHKAKHQGKTRFICEVCGYRTIEAGSFRRHTFTHSGKKLFKCPDCSYKATSRYVVVKHIYGKHINHKRYACNKCDFKTAYYSGLSMHLMAHEGIKPYKCSLCPYRSNLSNKVKRHCSQKHSQAEAKAIKVENCLRFDVKDYLNPEVSKVDVKVIRLTEDGEVQEEEEEEEIDEAEKASAVLDPDINEDDSLLCESQIPVLPPGNGEGLDDISIMDGGFGLCNDPTFPLDSVAQTFPSEDSNSVFLTRPSRLNSSGADVELSKEFDIQKSKVPYFDSPETSLQMSAGSEPNISEMTPVELTNLSWRSNSLECLVPLKNSVSIGKSSKTMNPVISFSNLEEGTTERLDTPNEDIRPQLPLLSTSTPFMQVVNLPVVTPPPLLTHDANQASVHPKPLKSLLSPEVLKSMSVRSFQNQSDNSSLNDISLTLSDPCLNEQQSRRTVVLTVPSLLTLADTKQPPDKLDMKLIG